MTSFFWCYVYINLSRVAILPSHICIQKKKVVQKPCFFCEIVDRIYYLSYPDARISAPSIYYTKNQNFRSSSISCTCQQPISNVLILCIFGVIFVTFFRFLENSFQHATSFGMYQFLCRIQLWKVYIFVRLLDD